MSRSAVAFCSISALDRSLAAAAAVARAAGCDAVEVTARPPHLDPEAGVDAAREAGSAVRAEGVEVVAYGSYLGRFGITGTAAARREAALAAALRAPLLRVWAEPQEGDDEGFAAVVEMLQAAADAAAASGIVVVVERHRGSLADTPERIDRLLDAVSRPNLALNYQVLDFLALDEIQDQPADATRLVPLARYFHLKNYARSPEPGGRVLPGASLAEGLLDYREILRSSFAAGYAGPLTIEFLSHAPRPVEEKLASDVAFVRGLLEELGAA